MLAASSSALLASPTTKGAHLRKVALYVLSALSSALSDPNITDAAQGSVLTVTLHDIQEAFSFNTTA